MTLAYLFPISSGDVVKLKLWAENDNNRIFCIFQSVANLQQLATTAKLRTTHGGFLKSRYPQLIQSPNPVVMDHHNDYWRTIQRLLDPWVPSRSFFSVLLRYLETKTPTSPSLDVLFTLAFTEAWIWFNRLSGSPKIGCTCSIWRFFLYGEYREYVWILCVLYSSPRWQEHFLSKILMIILWICRIGNFTGRLDVWPLKQYFVVLYLS